jgi:23S rRNA pseudouridine2605 synthase
MGERIAKVMARVGLCSRRDAESWITAGRVSVNGAVISTPALNVTANDQIRVDGKPLPQRERTRLFLFHKPVGLVTTHDDPQQRATVFDALPKDLPRLLTVGRLDINSEGLLLLTNDGGLARVLELPETGWLRRYRARAYGDVTQQQLDRLRAGITVEGVRYGAIEATLDRTQGSNVWLTIGIREGKNREIRNVLRAIDLQVNRLIRISFGPFQLGELPVGEVEEVGTRILREQLGARIARDAGCDFSAPIIPFADQEFSARTPVIEADVMPPRPHATSAGRERDDRHSGRRQPSDPRHKDRGDVAGRRRKFGKNERFGKNEKNEKNERGHAARVERPSHRKPKAKSGPAWRDHEASGRRRFHGSRRDAAETEMGARTDKRAGLLTDRKGRRILVERFGAPRRAEDADDADRRTKHRSKERSQGRPPRRGGGGHPRPGRPKGR